MKKTTLNLTIDAIMFLCLSAVLSIGLLLKFTLKTGQEKWAIYGENIHQTIFGMNRHEWGYIHFIIGIVFTSLLALHLVLHWKGIKIIYKRIWKNNILKTLFAVFFFLTALAILIFPFVISPNSH